jgi:hypothetical protein
MKCIIENERISLNNQNINDYVIHIETSKCAGQQENIYSKTGVRVGRISHVTKDELLYFTCSAIGALV